MIDGNVLAQSITDTFKDDKRYDKITEMQTDYCEVFRKHFEQMQLLFAWVGATTSVPPVVDPIVAFTGSIKFQEPANNQSMFNFVPAPDFNTMLLQLAAKLKTGTITISDPTMVAVPTLNPGGAFSIDMSSFSSGTVKSDAVIKFLCMQIVTQVKSNFLNPTPTPGVHAGSFVGVLTMTGIL